MKDVAFSVKHAPLHVRAFYGRLIEYLRQELGESMDILGDEDYDDLAELEGMYKVVMFCTRGAAINLTKNCQVTRSFLVDHGPIHTNRAPHGVIDFEVFSSPYLNDRYSADGFRAKVKSWSGGYFLTDHLCSGPIRGGECLVYSIHNVGWYANSMAEVPFSDDETLDYLRALSKLFKVVHVVSHINAGGNFVEKYRDLLPENVLPVAHGFSFMDLIASVEAVFMEYSSVMAACLWNPEVKLFVRYPKHVLGPITLQARYLHELMESAAYPIVNDMVGDVMALLSSDPKRGKRVEARTQIYDLSVEDPYYEVLKCVREAIAMS
jgi:hypothetical protein